MTAERACALAVRASYGARPFSIVVWAALTALSGGCSLVSFKSPERPLSERDLNTRVLTYDFANRFAAAVTTTSDNIANTETEEEVRLQALRWKIGATAASQRAASQMAPQMALLDSWTLAVQMRNFLRDGAGARLFGSQQAKALQTAEQLVSEAERIATQVTPPDELGTYRTFVTQYAAAHPLPDLGFLRPSIVNAWTASGGQEVKLVDSMGTIPEALADLESRMHMYGDNAPDLILWRSELALRSAGYGQESVQDALERLDGRLETLATQVSGAPGAFKDSLADVRATSVSLANRFDASISSAATDLRAEREALASDIAAERAAVVMAFDDQRAAVARDANVLLRTAVTTAGLELRRTLREVFLGFALLILITLGLPFAAGYWIGQARMARSARGGNV
jgi:hypothetical protein